ncbi:MAG: hypothetical protein KC777_05925, partial [Cyanobacteria bacterium HKST-UBA02]|nr:hypothetical protein [Cyanobacteria bacterium HKST-UBA02]
MLNSSVNRLSMSLTTLFRVVLTFMTVFFVVLLILIFNIQKLQNDTVEAEERRHNSYRLAEQMRQSSDDLTRMARSYVCSGREDYLDYYRQILEIRNGKIGRPKNYSSTYWYLFPGGVIESKPGKPASLESKMRETGFSEKELKLLSTSRQRSDNLVKIEEESFAAMKGNFKDGDGEFTIERDPDPSYARKLLFSQEYDREKVKIMEPIEEFLREVDERTRHDMVLLEIRERLYIRYAIALLGGFL